MSGGPELGLPLREMLLDDATFREQSRNSGRPNPTRMAHVLCELFYRARLTRRTSAT
jgi:hypothetical protein